MKEKKETQRDRGLITPPMDKRPTEPSGIKIDIKNQEQSIKEMKESIDSFWLKCVNALIPGKTKVLYSGFWFDFQESKGLQIWHTGRHINLHPCEIDGFSFDDKGAQCELIISRHSAGELLLSILHRVRRTGIESVILNRYTKGQHIQAAVDMFKYYFEHYHIEENSDYIISKSDYEVIEDALKL